MDIDVTKMIIKRIDILYSLLIISPQNKKVD